MPFIASVSGTTGSLGSKRAFSFPRAATLGFPTIASGSSITLPITAPSDTGGLAIIDYTITSTPATTTKTTSSAGNYTFTGLTPGTLYTFTVKARNAYGTSSDSAAFATSSSVTPDEVPGKMTATLNTDSATTSTWGWSAPTNNGTAITQWGRQVSTDNGATWGAETIVAVGTTTYSITVATGPSGGVYSSPDTNTYRVRMRAYNAAGAGAWSDNDNRNTPWSLSTFTVTDSTCTDGSCSTSQSQTDTAANETRSVACGVTCGSQSQYRTPKRDRSRTGTRTRSRTRTEYRYIKGVAQTGSYGVYAGLDWGSWSYSGWTWSDGGTDSVWYAAWGGYYYSPDWTNTGGCGSVGLSAVSPSEGQVVSIWGWLQRNGYGDTPENKRYRRYVGLTDDWAVSDAAGNLTECRTGCSGVNCCLYSTGIEYCSAYNDYVPSGAQWWNICGSMYGVYPGTC